MVEGSLVGSPGRSRRTHSFCEKLARRSLSTCLRGSSVVEFRDWQTLEAEDSDPWPRVLRSLVA